MESRDTQTHHLEAFVDETGVAHNDALTPYTAQELAKVVQMDAQHLEKLLLFTSGSKPKLIKCHFHLMYWGNYLPTYCPI